MAKTYQNILITGGCGFMGSHVVRYFYENYPEYRVYNIDALTYAGNPENLVDIESRELLQAPEERRYHFLKGDVCDELFLRKLFESTSFRFVFHMAAETHVDRSIFNVSDFVKTNIEGTRTLLEFVRAHPKTRFIYMSTDEVYGDVTEGLSSEDAPLRPSNPYATSKAGADLLVQAYRKTYEIPVIIVRSSNNYGTHQYPEKLIPMTISNLIDGARIPIHGNGGHVRSWLHIADFCDAIDRIIHAGEDGEIYNIAGEHKTNKEIVYMIASYLNVDSNAVIDYVADRPGADFRYAPDPKKIDKRLGWRQVHFIEEEIKNVIEWYLSNRAWWEQIKKTKEFVHHYEKQAKAQWY